MPESVDIIRESTSTQDISQCHTYPLAGEEPAVRPAMGFDLNRIMEIERACFPEHLAYSREKLYYLIFKARSTTLVEEFMGCVRGYVTVLYRKNSEVAGIETIGVDPYFRGLGVGKRLLSAAEQDMISRGVRYSLLEVSAGNRAALEMYKKAGYRVCQNLENYYQYEHHKTRTAYRMKKAVDSPKIV
jgi:ribosomal protein S18 acetylase RimI-like enzyme